MYAKKLAFVFCIGLGLSGPVLAAGNPFYVGVKGGTMMVDLSEYDDASSLGVLLGYRITDDSSGSVAVEAEFTNSSSSDITVLGKTGNWDINTFAGYLTYRTPGNLYLKGKIGFLNEDINVNIVGANISGSDSGLSIGVGGGWKLGTNAALELEYTVIEQDINFLSLGVNFSF